VEILEALKTTVEKVKEWTNNNLENKVDKVSGKGLSTNDYTAADKEKVYSMPNDLVFFGGQLYLAKDGVPISDSAVTLPSGGGGSGGGGGGGSGSDDVIVENKSPSTTLSAALGTDVWITLFFASSNPGNGMAHIFVTSGNNDRVLKGSVPITNGKDNPINLKNYIAGGTNVVDIVCADQYGSEGRLQYIVNAISLAISTSFSDSGVFTKSTGIPITIKFDGSITKTLHFEMTYPDLSVKDYTVPNIEYDNASATYDILKVAGTLSHGTYLTKVYTTATTDDGTTITSNIYVFDIMYSEGKTTPLISSVYNITSVAQGTPIYIPFTVYHTTQMNPEVTLSIEPSEQDGKKYLPDIRTVTSGARQSWDIKNYPTGEVTFTISYGDISKSHTITVTPSVIKQKVRTDNMKFYISAAGKSNESAERDIWNGVDDEGNVVASTTFTDVNWAVANKRFETSYEDEKGEIITTTTQYAIGTGWATDNNGDTVLRLAGNARALINFKPYEINPKTHGKTIELVFAIRDVNNRDAVAMSCMSGGVGFTVTSDTATFTNGSTSAVCNYVDGEKLHVTLVIEPQGTDDNPNTRLFCAYLNGVMSSAMQYTTVESLHQGNPVGISVGSSECSIDLYSIRTYDIALTKEEVRDNFIADSGDVAISVENDIYSGSAMLLSKVETQIPVMRITGALPSLKKDSNKKKGGKDYPVKIVYTDPINTDLNFTDSALIHVQGTSSEGYPRKNWKIEFDNEHQHMPGMIPSDVFCMKTDFAENTGSHNTGNANYVHTFYDSVKTPPQEVDSRVRTTIAGFPCVIFHRLSSSDPYTFAGRYNFNYEKSSNNAYGLTDEYPNSESWEFRENKELACQFLDEIPQDVDEWNGPIFEARHPDGSEDIEAFRVMHEWVLSTNQAEATGGALTEPYVDVDGVTHTKDTAKYRLAKFKTEFENYFELDFMLIYYLYTFVMLMVDQRAKNMFLTTWDKVHFQAWLYDNDFVNF
jgi:hypothetical protein